MVLSEHILLDIVDKSPLATAIYDTPDLHIAYVNQYMLDTWRADRSIVGRTFSACFPSFEKEGFSSILKNVWKTGISYKAKDTPADILFENKKTKRYFDFEYKALLDADGKTYAILHSSWDVTDRKLADDRMKSQKEQLAFNRKLDLLAHTLSHDLKNPLSVLKMSNSFLLSNLDKPADVTRRWHENMALAIRNVESIINQNLQISKVRVSQQEAEYIEMDKKIDHCIAEVKLVFPQGKIKFKLGHLYPLYMDRGVAFQIFFNLLSNAVKYAKMTDQDYVEISSEKTSKGIVYYLEDNGTGIPDHELDHIFRHPEPSGKSSKGSGIGLSLVKELVERMEGTINLSSEFGKGTLVRLFFPYMD